ncbi:hypothetical protein RRG08_010583 [Elysia crispata]|uniref:Uncharacterized protein n=1 Tax=Elysia crispata TaxID=231223 RepID=A0AAE0ZTP6_9GAST|nr:hypothetical protein RRG08_010583 [Elysia crispata]
MEDNMEGHEEQLKENKENNHSKKKMSAKERMQAYRARLKANKAQHDKVKEKDRKRKNLTHLCPACQIDNTEKQRSSGRHQKERGDRANNNQDKTLHSFYICTIQSCIMDSHMYYNLVIFKL